MTFIPVQLLTMSAAVSIILMVLFIGLFLITVYQILWQTDDADVHRPAVIGEHGRLYLYLGAVGFEGGVYMVAGRRLMACAEQDALTGMAVDEP